MLKIYDVAADSASGDNSHLEIQIEDIGKPQLFEQDRFTQIPNHCSSITVSIIGDEKPSTGDFILKLVTFLKSLGPQDVKLKFIDCQVELLGVQDSETLSTLPVSELFLENCSITSDSFGCFVSAVTNSHEEGGNLHTSLNTLEYTDLVEASPGGELALSGSFLSSFSSIIKHSSIQAIQGSYGLGSEDVPNFSSEEFAHSGLLGAARGSTSLTICKTGATFVDVSLQAEFDSRAEGSRDSTVLDSVTHESADQKMVS